MNFFEHQQQARKQTKRLIAYFIIAVICIIVLINMAIYFGACVSNVYCSSPEAYVLGPLGIGVSVVTLLIIAITSLIRWRQLKKGGGYKAITMAGARSVNLNTKDPAERRLINVVEEMSIASGIPMPSLFIMENETAINAFVAGTEPHNTCLAVTRGCLDKLNRQELQGVIGHEYSHIFNGDMRINIYLIGILAGILVIGQLGEFLTRSQRYSYSSRRKNNGAQLALVGVALMLVGYAGLFFGRLIKAAISRQREFLADASAVQYTRDNQGISFALYKIKMDHAGSHLATKSAEELSHMCFERSHPIKFFSGLLATHPNIDDRIKQVNPYFSAKEFTQRSTADAKSQQSTNNEGKTHRNEPHSNAAQDFFNHSVIASAITENTGQISAKNVDVTQWQISLLPETLKQVARGNHKLATPQHLVYCLLVLNNTMTRADVLHQAAQFMAEEDLVAISELLPDTAPLKLTQQFLLLELSLPRIKTLSQPQSNSFLSHCKLLVDGDKQVSLQEYVIYALCLLTLQQDNPMPATIKRFESVSEDIQQLLATFLYHSTVSRERKKQIYQQLMASFNLSGADYSETEFNANRFHRALTQLARLNPLLKKPVIDALAHCVSSNNRVEENEFILIRAVCSYLDCPVPKLL